MSKKNKRAQQEKRLAMFKGDFYQEKFNPHDQHWYVKMWNGNANKWQVARYSQKSFRAYKGYQREKPHIPESFRLDYRKEPEFVNVMQKLEAQQAYKKLYGN